MENKKVQFTSLKRQEIRRTIKNGDCPILIYNPSSEVQNKIKMFMSKRFSNDYKELNISSVDLIVMMLPLLTNIDLGLDANNADDRKIIEGIIADPSDSFAIVIDELSDIVQEVGDHFIHQVDFLSKLPKEQLEKILKINSEPQLSDKEKKKIELKKQLEELEKDNK